MGVSFREQLISGSNVLLGSFLGIPSPPLMEMLGLAGFDFGIIDMEHGNFDLERLEDCLRAALSVDMPCLVRVPGLDFRLIQLVLDLGADGIQVPQIENANEARSVVEICHFPPLGKRGFGSTTRVAGFGFRDRATVIEKANQQTIIGIQIETRTGVDNLPQILAVPGIDLIFIGTSDLSLSYGFSTPNHPQISSVVGDLVPKIVESGRVPGIYLSDWTLLAGLTRLGLRYFTVSAGMLIKEAFRRDVQRFNWSKEST